MNAPLFVELAKVLSIMNKCNLFSYKLKESRSCPCIKDSLWLSLKQRPSDLFCKVPMVKNRLFPKSLCHCTGHQGLSSLAERFA